MVDSSGPGKVDTMGIEPSFPRTNGVDLPHKTHGPMDSGTFFGLFLGTNDFLCTIKTLWMYKTSGFIGLFMNISFL